MGGQDRKKVERRDFHRNYHPFQRLKSHLPKLNCRNFFKVYSLSDNWLKFLDSFSVFNDAVLHPYSPTVAPAHCSFLFPLAADPKASQSTWYSLVQSFCSVSKRPKWVAGSLRCGSLSRQGSHRGPKAMESLQPVQKHGSPSSVFSMCHIRKKTVKHYSNLTYSGNKHQHQPRSIMLLGTGATNQKTVPYHLGKGT